MAADPLTKNTVDDLFNFDIDSNDLFGEKTANKPRDDKSILSPRAAKRRADADDADGFGLDLGLDQEVKIKKRKPNPKLDETLLLSKPGIPKLRALAKDGISKKLRLKGKGHEFSDVAMLLNYFQLWLDDLYPKAKFADGLQMVEKVGHSKRMQVMRREWINESKHKELYGDDDMYGGQTNAATGNRVPPPDTGLKDYETRPVGIDDDSHEDSLFFPDVNRKPEARGSDEPEVDELDALLAQHSTYTLSKPHQRPMADDSEGEDDLDALLAEAERSNATTKPQQTAVEADDLDALLVERSSRKEVVLRPGFVNDVGEDDLDALMAE